jgi:hypothetical protein
VTTIDFGGVNSDRHITTYFRKKVAIDNLEELGAIVLGLQRDDGAVIYVNGTEVGRSQMPGGEIGFDTRASGSREEDTIFDFELPSELFNEGENVIAVEVHQASPSSSDMIFDFRMNGMAPTITNPDSIKLEWDADWDSGPLNDFKDSIKVPSSTVRSGSIYRARVRHKDSTGRWSNWSDPIEFEPSTPDLSDYNDSLLITEIMYHPGSPSIEEVEAGYLDDYLFEYIEIKNIGEMNLDLRDLRFTKGIDFDFLGSKKEFIGPGEYVLIVNNIKAFEMRYGSGLPIAGQWEDGDRLANGGEQIKLSFGGGDPLIEFNYDDTDPWPELADGSGPSMVLMNLNVQSDYGAPESWKPSASLEGTPGKDESGIVYSNWQIDKFGEGEPGGSAYMDDPDEDGVVNLFEYALGSDPLDKSSVPEIQLRIIEDDGRQFIALEYKKINNRSDVILGVERSFDLQQWESGEGLTSLYSNKNGGDGYLIVTEISNSPLRDSGQQNIRLAVKLIR